MNIRAETINDQSGGSGRARAETLRWVFFFLVNLLINYFSWAAYWLIFSSLEGLQISFSQLNVSLPQSLMVLPIRRLERLQTWYDTKRNATSPVEMGILSAGLIKWFDSVCHFEFWYMHIEVIIHSACLPAAHKFLLSICHCSGVELSLCTLCLFRVTLCW